MKNIRLLFKVIIGVMIFQSVLLVMTLAEALFSLKWIPNVSIDGWSRARTAYQFMVVYDFVGLSFNVSIIVFLVISMRKIDQILKRGN